jgi:ABC-type transport system involved in cytochrome c biogenesis permease subunit
MLKPQAGMMWPAMVTGVCALYLLAAGRPPKLDSPFDLGAFARVPISYEGRVMPLDTLARTSLRIISGKSELSADGKRLAAIQWLADTFADVRGATHKVFRIDHPDLKGVLGLPAHRKSFAYEELLTASKEFDEQVHRAGAVAPKQQNAYQKSVMELWKHVQLFHRLVGLETLFVAPPVAPGEDWKSFRQAAEESRAGAIINPGAQAVDAALRSYHESQPEIFNSTLADYLAWFGANHPDAAGRANFEVIFNHFEPFIHTMTLYVLVFLLTCASWLFSRARPTLQRTAFWVMCLALVVHTLGLVARVYIQGRPPVTNLYSSAVFIGWAAVLFCAVIEWIYRNGIGMLAASIVAFPTLIIAHFLAGSGDTMQMLQAVLDTNIWLATHVVVITLGYAATFLAGIIAAIYIVAGLFTRALDSGDRRKSVVRMVYGVVCFAMLFSFVGTILGGIWADQSWGRFWGWDPKENGAVLIVLWNAIILHARWGGLVRERGLMCLAIFGNIVTSWSWFGTNMLGVGLHSYGFMDSAVFWLGTFIATQLLIIAVGNLPLAVWRSFRNPTSAAIPPVRLAAPLAGRSV